MGPCAAAGPVARILGQAKGMAGIVLAGGQSRRMGADKAFVTLAGEPMLRHVVRRVAAACTPVLVVAPADRLESLRSVAAGDTPQAGALMLVPDLYPARGPLAGLHAGLLAAGGGYHFVVSCDQPLLEPAAVRYLLQRAQSAGTSRPDAVVPRVGGRLQVLHAVYHGRVADGAAQLLARGELAIRRLLEDLSWLEVPEAELAPFGDTRTMFLNVNTPDDLAEAERQLGGSASGHSS